MDNLGDKAKKGLSKGLEFLRNRAQETVEIHKSNAYIKELQKRHEESIRDLGYRVYGMMQKGEIDQRALRERFLEALELEKAIERGLRDQTNIRDQFRTDLQIFVPKDTPMCKNCGAVVMAFSKFCPECGASLAEDK